MLKNQRWSERKARKKELKRCFETAETLDPKGEEYYRVMQRIADLKKQDNKMNANTAIACLTSVLQISGIIAYESFGNIIKTKGLSFVNKVKF